MKRFLALDALRCAAALGLAVPNDRLVLLPAVVWLLATVQAGAALGAVCGALGAMSYPLYILHVPLYRLAYATLPLRALLPVAATLAVAAGCIAAARADAALRRVLMARLDAGMHAAGVGGW